MARQPMGDGVSDNIKHRWEWTVQYLWSGPSMQEFTKSQTPMIL